MAPWLAAETQLKRKVCFSAALELHRTFIDAAAKPIRPSSSGGRMVLAKQPEESEILQVLGPSRWLHVEGSGSGKWCVQTLDDLHGWKVSVLAQTGLSFDRSTSSGKLTTRSAAIGQEGEESARSSQGGAVLPTDRPQSRAQQEYGHGDRQSAKWRNLPSSGPAANRDRAAPAAAAPRSIGCRKRHTSRRHPDLCCLTQSRGVGQELIVVFREVSGNFGYRGSDEQRLHRSQIGCPAM